MAGYYYLVSQLPYLEFGEEPPIEVGGMLDEAEKWLSGGKLAVLSSVDLFDTEIYGNEPQVLKKYKRYERKLRQELVAWREARDEGTEHKPTLFGIDLLKDDTPLDVETNLYRLRWNYIGELEIGLHFQFPVIVLYSLKLQILQKLDTFDKEAGMKKFKHYTELDL